VFDYFTMLSLEVSAARVHI